MSDKVTFRNNLLRMFRARIPFISIRSIERARVLEVIHSLAEEINIQMYVHSLSQGTLDIKNKKTVHEDRSVSGGLEFAVQQISQRQNVTFVFTEVSDMEDDNLLSRHIYDAVLQAIERGGSICVISSKSIWPQLQRLGMTITLNSPNEEEMLEIVKECIQPYAGAIRINWEEQEFRIAASTLANMTKIEAENVLATLLAKGSLEKDDLADLATAKDKLFSDISGLEKVRTNESMPGVAGLSGLQQWLNYQHQLLAVDLKPRKLRAPRGLLLVGVPGCGKSLSAKFVATTWKLPLYRLDFASIHGQYLGQSENRLKEALASAENAAPCVLWIDEIEKGLSAGQDGGTSQRLVGQFLFWLQESTARVFVVATANDVSQLPPELLRRGRFDELFFVDLPSLEERKAIIELYIARNLLNTPSADGWQSILSLAEGFSGADLEGAVRDVAVQAVIHGDEVVTDELYIKCFTNIVPLSKTAPEKIESIRAWGRERAVPASGNAGLSQADEKEKNQRVILL